MNHSAGYGCGCFVKVHVCERCIGIADEYLTDRVRDLTDQLQLNILDTLSSVSALEDGGR